MSKNLINELGAVLGVIDWEPERLVCFVDEG